MDEAAATESRGPHLERRLQVLKVNHGSAEHHEVDDSTIAPFTSFNPMIA